jgi:D-alanyl-D-alanine dipeptidase
MTLPTKENKADGAEIIGHIASPTEGTEPSLNIPFSAEELDWVAHAARLRSLTTVEYVRRAINLSLRQEGVDAVLLKESDDDAGVPRCAMCEHVFDDDEVVRVVEMKLVCEDCYHDLPEAE